jgi:hypothetical protein
MRDGVIGEAAQIAARRLRELLGFLAHLPAVIDAPDQDRQRATRMRQVDVQVGVAVEHAAEDQVARGDRGVERIAEQIGEIEALHALATDGLQRMQEHRQAELLDPREDRLEGRIVEIAVVDVGAHVDAAHARQLAHPVELVDGTLRVEHRQGRKHDETIRMRFVGFDGRIVPSFRQSMRQVGVGPVQHRRGQRERVHADALAIHVGEALLDVGEFFGQRPGRARRRLDHEGVVGRHDLEFEARSLAGDEIEIGLREIMRVCVDGADPGCGGGTGALCHCAVRAGGKDGGGEPSLQDAPARRRSRAATFSVHGIASHMVMPGSFRASG